ncbi:hypothetical protein AAMO2058_000470300 [Amorphochlora amoebiformis]
MEEALACVSRADGRGQTLRDHLARLVIALKDKDEKKTKSEIEKISISLKETTFTLPVPKEIPSVMREEGVQTIIKNLSKLVTLCKVPPSTPLPPPPEEKEVKNLEEGEDELPPTIEHYPWRNGDTQASTQDIEGDSTFLSWAGVSLGSDTTAMLALSVRELSVKKQTKQARFFGKIIGLKADYYIVEAACPQSLIDSDQARVAAEAKAAKQNKTTYAELDHSEPWGVGVNQLIYFATNSPTATAEEWTMLPRVQPLWIRTARETRRFFTGNLSARVGGYPYFPWGEAALLRARIALIAHSCSLAPAGYFVPDDEVEEGVGAIMYNAEYVEEEVKKAEDLWIPNDDKNDPANLVPDVMASAANWTHILPFIRMGSDIKGVNNGGRVTAWTPVENDEDEDQQEQTEDVGEQYNPEDDEEEVPEEILRTLEEDKSDFTYLVNEEGDPLPPWKFEVCTAMGKFPTKVPNAVIAAHSLVWPGAVCISNGTQFCNIYVGNGQPRLPTFYSTPAPPVILDEWKDPNEEEQEEDAPPIPNGLAEKKDPRVPKPDLDEDEDDED